MKTRMNWFKYVKPYLAFFILGPLCMIIEVIGDVLMPKLLQMIMDGTSPFKMMGWELSPAWNVISIALLMLVVVAFMLLGGVGGAYFGSKAAVNFAADLRRDVYGKIQKYSFSNIDKFSTGSLVTRMTNDVTQVQNFVNMLLRMALRAPGMMIGGIVMAIILKPSLSLVLAVTIPIMLVVLLVLINIGFPRFGTVQTKIDKLNSTVRENVTNVRVVKSFVREKHEMKKFRAANDELKTAGMRAVGVMIFMSPVMNIFMYTAVIAIVLIGQAIVLNDANAFIDGSLLYENSMTVGKLSAFVMYATQILSSLMMVTMLFMISSRALASAKRIKEVINEAPDIIDTNAAQPDKKVEKGSVEFRNVSFKYFKHNSEEVLDNISFSIDSGSTVGIIGSTGSGKTTLISMIPRLYDVDSGSVLVDGVDVRDYSIKNLRDGVSIVLQKNLLFSGTIKDNLLWGNNEASLDEIKTVCTYSAADKFISTFKDGYDTVLEKGGTNLSGGQKQRVCIARALLKKPKILILDDSTSAVDTATEKQIQFALKNYLPECTKIIIAQRINSVREADMIIVMNDGAVTGIGTHDELLQNNKEYAEICYSQMDKESAAGKAVN